MARIRTAHPWIKRFLALAAAQFAPACRAPYLELRPSRALPHGVS